MWFPASDDAWLRPAPSRDGVRKDALLAFALMVVGLAGVELLRSTPGAEAIDDRPVESLLWSAAITLPLALRRIYPVTVMVVCSLVFYGMGERVPVAVASIVVQAALFMAIYAAWAWSQHRQRLLVASALMVLGMFVWLAQLIAEMPTAVDTPGLVPAGVAVGVVTVAVNIVYFFGAIAWGLVSYRDAHRRQQLVEQAEALRREQERNAERAVAEDRLRIARDLHDAVAHHVTGIGIQAAAARHVLDRDPASSRTALAAIEQSSRSAVHEMHQIVGLLRDDDAAQGPPRTPGLAGLSTLALDAESDRLTVRYREVGDPFDVPDPVGTSLFRTAQEALTNVRRHSTAREAEMVLRYVDAADRAVEVEVLDAGTPVPHRDDTRRGYGLQGLRERAAVHDATVDIGPRPEGGFRVRVRFPVPQAAP